ncbi:MAG: type II toxin-antitoxin system VapC family toxin [Actinomycetota bacterium]|nr:type II toxin-antitoxin system VapC family toxin [Actinomycetota bacterium]
MLLVDANLLLHAVNTDAAEHALARAWLEQRLADTEPVAFAWVVLLAFVRVGTRQGLLPSPMSPTEAFDHIEGWLSQRNALMVHPTVRHAAVLRGLLEPLGTAGNLTSDAHLAALAVEHGATLVSFDRDFGRFSGVRWQHPVQAVE